MAQTINTNLVSLNAQRNLSRAQRNRQRAVDLKRAAANDKD